MPERVENWEIRLLLVTAIADQHHCWTELSALVRHCGSPATFRKIWMVLVTILADQYCCLTEFQAVVRTTLKDMDGHRWNHNWPVSTIVLQSSVLRSEPVVYLQLSEGPWCPAAQPAPSGHSWGRPQDRDQETLPGLHQSHPGISKVGK